MFANHAHKKIFAAASRNHNVLISQLGVETVFLFGKKTTRKFVLAICIEYLVLFVPQGEWRIGVLDLVERLGAWQRVTKTTVCVILGTMAGHEEQ